MCHTQLNELLLVFSGFEPSKNMAPASFAPFPATDWKFDLRISKQTPCFECILRAFVWGFDSVSRARSERGARP